MTDTFPRQHARTQRFTLGEPRTITVSADGSTVLFLRSAGGEDPVTSLWRLDVATGSETCVADAAALTTGGGDSPAERARRERAREAARGIVGYSCTADASVAAFLLAGTLYRCDIRRASCDPLADGPFADPQVSPDGRKVAAVRGRALVLVDGDGDGRGDSVTVLADDPSPDIAWGLAEFIAAEEMGRIRGFWWSPDGATIAACRIDESQVALAHVADPATPTVAPSVHRYPFAGTANVDVELHLIDVADATRGTSRRVEWDRSALPYLARTSWTRAGLVATVQSRDQRRAVVLRVDPDRATTSEVATIDDPHWVELVPGVPALDGTGRLLTCEEREGARALVVDGTAVTPPTLHVRHVAVVDDGAVFVATPDDDPCATHAWRWRDGHLEQLTSGARTTSAAAGGGTVVVRTTSLDAPKADVRVTGGPLLTNLASEPLVNPRPVLHRVGPRDIATAILLPSRHDGGPLPVLFDPYGGPHAQRAVHSRTAFATSQWFADQGFVVVVADGRGTPGRGTEWERAVAGDLAGPVLEDQLEVLNELPRLCPAADTSRTAIRGWSFGGYLAALAVLRAPDRFHAAVAGAPVTDWALYDTHYTERYLGDPATSPDAYRRSSLLDDAASLRRPLLLIHGLADDNVLVAHTVRLSSALLAAGAPHETLLLSGVTHMTPQEVVAENLLVHQLAFLRRALGVSAQ